MKKTIISILAAMLSLGAWAAQDLALNVAPADTLKIAKAELVKKPSAAAEDPTAPEYAVNIDEEIENGSVDADYTTAAKGTMVTLTPTPAIGYRLSRLLIEAMAEANEADARRKAPSVGYFVTATEQADGTWTFQMPNCPVLVSAQFEIDPNNPTAIEPVGVTPQGEGTWYDLRGHRVTIYTLSGQRVSLPVKGVNIVNGKKIVIK